MTPSVMKNDKSWRGMLLKVFIINMIIIIAISAKSHTGHIPMNNSDHRHDHDVQDNEGDWGVAVAAWRGMKKGQPGVPGIVIIGLIISIVIMITIIVNTNQPRHPRAKGEARS